MASHREKVIEFDQGYNVTVTGRHVQVTDGMKQHAVDQISRIDRIGDRIVDVHVTMDIQKLQHRVDISMKYGHTFIRSHAATTDMYVSIDQAIDKLERQLKKYKQKLRDYHAKELPVEEVPVHVYAVDEAEEATMALGGHTVVATETQALKIMTEDEAIMKMELSGDLVMIYRSEEKKRLHVIYRRADGNYGIIQPEL